MLNKTVQKEILKLQTKKLEKMKFCNKPYKVNVLGKEIIVMPSVFYPASDTELIINALCTHQKHYLTNKRILEACSGTGVISIFLSKYAKSITATDINPAAIENIKANMKKHNLEGKIKAIKTDIFSKEQSKFDLIVINPPYTDNEAKDIIEKAIWDKNHNTIKKFLRKAKNYLRKDGKIYISWANFADFDFIEEQFKINNYNFNKIAELKKDIKIYRVYRLTQ